MPHHTCVPSSIDPHLYCTTFAHLRANSFPVRACRNLSELIRTYQRKSDPFRLVLINSDKFRYPLRNIPLAPTTRYPCISAPSPTHLRRNRSTSAHVRTLSYRGKGAVLPYEQIVAPMLSEGMYRGIGEKSIGYPRKVYRVFPESLYSFPKKSIEYFPKVYRLFSNGTIHPLRYLPSFAPIPSYKRSVPSHPPFQYLSTSKAFPHNLRPDMHNPLPQHLPSSALFPSYKRSNSIHTLPHHHTFTALLPSYN